MSRRSRRRSDRSRSPWTGRFAAALLILVILGVLGGFLGIRAYLHSDAFRQMVSRQTGRTLQGKAEFGPFRWQGLHARTDHALFTGDGPIAELRADGVATEVGLDGWSSGAWKLRGVHVRRLSARIDLTGKTQRPAVARARAGGGDRHQARTRWLPARVELADAEISNIEVSMNTRQGPVSLSGMRMQAASDGSFPSFAARLDGGTVKLPFEFCPSLGLRSAELRWRKDMLFLHALDAEVWGRGRCQATGEWDRKASVFALDGTVNDVPTSELLRGDWVKRVTGTVDATFRAAISESEQDAHGDIRITDGTLTALPVLDVLAAYADTSRFRFLPLHEARARWRWHHGVLRLSDIVLFSEGLARLEGSFGLRGETIEGSFRLGLPPGTLAGIPGAETDVFVPGEHGLMWTTLRVTGTLNDPKEDLSQRLIEAAGLRMFDMLPDTGERVLRHSRTLAKDLAPKVLEKGIRVLDEGQQLLHGASGLLDALLPSPMPPARQEREK